MDKKQSKTFSMSSNSTYIDIKRQKVTNVTDEMRLTLILLISEFSLSCYLAAKVLEIPYTNAKVIYRIFKKENRVVQNSRNPQGNHNFLPSQVYLLNNSLDALRIYSRQKLIEALHDKSIFTES